MFPYIQEKLQLYPNSIIKYIVVPPILQENLYLYLIISHIIVSLVNKTQFISFSYVVPPLKTNSSSTTGYITSMRLCGLHKKN